MGLDPSSAWNDDCDTGKDHFRLAAVLHINEMNVRYLPADEVDLSGSRGFQSHPD